MAKSISQFFSLALSAPVVKTASRVSLLVGTLLALINHGDTMLAQSMSLTSWLQVALSYVVPYCVSSYSAVKVLQAQ